MAVRKGHRKVQSDTTSITLRNVEILDDSLLPEVESTIKTWNSVARCAFKRFQSMNLRANLKSQKEPRKRKSIPKFLDYAIEDGKALKYECPDGMSEEMWREMRWEAYGKKRSQGLKNANPFWQIDKDLGSPVSSTMKVVGDWAKSNGHFLDSVLVHDATMLGYRTHMSFEGKKARWLTSKDSPSFGDMEGRSRKKLTKEEFQLTRNASLTVTGRKEKNGNPKFKFDLDKMEMTFTLNRRKIGFSFNGTRFSRKGLSHLATIISGMENGKLPVTVTLTRTDKTGRFHITLAYSTKAMSELKKENWNRKSKIKSVIYATDEIVHHAIFKNGKPIHSRTYRIDEVSGTKKVLPQISHLKWKGKNELAAKLEKKCRNMTLVAARKVLSTIFKANRSYGVGEVVVESPTSRSRKNFNCSLIEFSRNKILEGTARPCFMSANRFVDMVKSNCARNGIGFNRANGAFVQTKAILSSRHMEEAIGKACLFLLENSNRTNKDIFNDLTYWSKKVLDPSMLDWVGHLLHNGRSRQARLDVRKAFQARAVEKAVRLVDNRSGRRCGRRGEASPLMLSL